jgi:hypothetical protein
MLDMPPLVWAAIAVPAAAGVLLARFLPRLWAASGLLREAVTPALPVERVTGPATRLGRATTDAITDAVALLDGQYGPLFLLALIMLLLWLGA